MGQVRPAFVTVVGIGDLLRWCLQWRLNECGGGGNSHLLSMRTKCVVIDFRRIADARGKWLRHQQIVLGGIFPNCFQPFQLDL